MINIFLLTILALVVIAAGVQLCRPKDHGQYEPMFKQSEFNIIDNGPNGKLEVTATMQMDSLTAAMLRHLKEEFYHKPKL